MGAIYFPSCNFTKASPKAARRLRSYLKEKMPVAGCCRVDNTPYPAGDKALYFCQACRELWNKSQATSSSRRTCLYGCWSRRISPGPTTAG